MFTKVFGKKISLVISSWQVVLNAGQEIILFTSAMCIFLVFTIHDDKREE